MLLALHSLRWRAGVGGLTVVPAPADPNTLQQDPDIPRISRYPLPADAITAPKRLIFSRYPPGRVLKAGDSVVGISIRARPAVGRGMDPPFEIDLGTVVLVQREGIPRVSRYPLAPDQVTRAQPPTFSRYPKRTFPNRPPVVSNTGKPAVNRGAEPATEIDLGTINFVQNPDVPIISRYPQSGQVVTRPVPSAVSRYAVAPTIQARNGLLLGIPLPTSPPKPRPQREPYGNTEYYPPPQIRSVSGGFTLGGGADIVFSITWDTTSDGYAFYGATSPVIEILPVISGTFILEGAIDSHSTYIEDISGGLIGGENSVDHTTQFEWDPSGGYGNGDVGGAGSNAYTYTATGGLLITGSLSLSVLVPGITVTTVTIIPLVVISTNIQPVTVITAAVDGSMYVNQRIKLQATFQRNGVLYDPANLRLVYRLPAAEGAVGKRRILHYGSSSIVRDSLGAYSLTIYPSYAGTVSGLWESTAYGEESIITFSAVIAERPADSGL